MVRKYQHTILFAERKNVYSEIRGGFNLINSFLYQVILF